MLKSIPRSKGVQGRRFSAQYPWTQRHAPKLSSFGIEHTTEDTIELSRSPTSLWAH